MNTTCIIRFLSYTFLLDKHYVFYIRIRIIGLRRNSNNRVQIYKFFYSRTIQYNYNITRALKNPLIILPKHSDVVLDRSIIHNTIIIIINNIL